jgi:hypothetical protein
MNVTDWFNHKNMTTSQILLYDGDLLALDANAYVQIVVLSDLHGERLRPGTELIVRRKGCEPASSSASDFMIP